MIEVASGEFERRWGTGRAACMAIPLLAAFTGCAAPDEVEPHTARSAIVRGVESDEEGVVFISADGTLCSATLVAPDLVMTSRDCLVASEPGTFGCELDGSLQPSSTPGAGVVGEPVQPDTIGIREGFVPADEPTTVGRRVFLHEGDTICRDNLAIVQLEDPLSASFFPLRLYEGTLPGEELRVVGYGANAGPDAELVDRREREVNVLRVGPSEFFPYEGFALPNTFVVGLGPCAGDTGGPALSDEGALVGILSLLHHRECDTEVASSTYTQLAPLRDWVLEVFAKTGNEPLLEEPPPGTGGEGGEASDSSGDAAGGGSTGGSGGTGGEQATSSSGSAGQPAERPSKNASGSGGASCGCRVGPQRSGSGAWLLTILLGFALRARRARQRRRAWARHRRVVLLGSTLAILLVSPRLAAEESAAARTAARDLGYEGVAAYQAGDYELALEKLERAYSLLKVPTLGLWSARALAQQGRLVEASERYLEVTRLELADDAPEVHAQAKHDASTERAALLERVPTLTVSLSGAPPSEVQLTLDEADFPSAFVNTQAPVDPGHHVLVGRWGEQSVTREVDVPEGTRATLTLQFEAPPVEPQAVVPPAPSPPPVAPPPPPPPVDHGPKPEPSHASTTLAYVSLGVGAAGLATWGVTGALALSEKDDFDASCTKRTCDAEVESSVKRYQNLRTASMVGFVVGAVGSVAGITLLLASSGEDQEQLARRGTNSSQTSLFIGANHAVLRHTF